MRGRMMMAVLVTAVAALASCGGDDDSTDGADSPASGDDTPSENRELADTLIADMQEAAADSEGAMEVDEDCVREQVGDLSASDAEIIASTWDSSEPPEGLSAEGAAAAVGLLGCMNIDMSGISIPDISMPDITVPSP